MFCPLGRGESECCVRLSSAGLLPRQVPLVPVVFARVLQLLLVAGKLGCRSQFGGSSLRSLGRCVRIMGSVTGASAQLINLRVDSLQHASRTVFGADGALDGSRGRFKFLGAHGVVSRLGRTRMLYRSANWAWNSVEQFASEHGRHSIEMPFAQVELFFATLEGHLDCDPHSFLGGATLGGQ